MRINPVYKKELKISVRTIRMSLIIFAYNAVLALISLLAFHFTFLGDYSGAIQYSNVLSIYLLIACVQFGLVLFVIPAFTSSAISGERERQTLEILLTTTMKPYQIIVGKLASSISETLLLVISSIPVLSIIFTVGGVEIKDILVLFFVTGITAIFIGSIGIFFSTVFKKTVPATIFTYGTLIILLFGTIIIAYVIRMVSVSAYDTQYYASGATGDYMPPTLTGLPYIFLVNPAVTMVSLVSGQFGDATYLERFLAVFGDVEKHVLNHWFGISIMIQLILAVFLLWIAAKRLNPIRKPRRK